MVKNRDEVRRDVLDMCGWVQDSYQLPENFFLEQFHKLLNNLEEELMMAKTSDEYNDIRVGVERTLVGMAQRHHLVEQYVFKKEVE
jgi:hypothetical protein